MPSYPLSFPSGIAPSADSMTLVSTSAFYQSVYTGQVSAQALPGQWWKRKLTFPPMPRDKAEALISMLCNLQGTVGSFTCGMFLSSTARGNTTGATPTVSGYSFDGTSISITGGPANRVGYLLAGDYFSVNNNILKALQDVNTNGSGSATFDVASRANSLKTPIGS